MLCARINENLHIRSLGANGLDVGERNAGVLLAEMKLRRHVGFVIGEANDGAAVIADRGTQSGQFGRGRIGHAAAETETDDANRADILDGVDGGLGVQRHRLPVRVGDEFAGDRDFVR